MQISAKTALLFFFSLSLLLFATLPGPGDGKEGRAIITRLTESQWLNGYYLYSWSPMCQRVAFALETEGNTDIWSCDSEGHDMQRLTSDPGQDILPSWSPDGRRIAFISDKSGSWNLWVMNEDGRERKKLLSVQKITPLVTEPVWSPDSSSLITISFKSGYWDLWRVDVETGKSLQLTCDERKELAFSWVENGERIIFASTDEGRSHICVMNSDGTDVKRLTPDEGVHLLPNASPDGTRIAYVKGGAMESSIDTMDFDGEAVEVLTHSPGISTLPRWAPDSKKISFISNQSGSMEVWTMGRSGEMPCQMTLNSGSPFGLRWAAKDLISFMTYGDSLFSLKTINPVTSHIRSLIPTLQVLDRPCWSNDATGLIASFFNGSISQIVSLGSEKGSTSPLFPELELSQRYPALSQQNDEVAFSLISGNDSQIVCGSLKGGPIRQLTSRRGRHILPSWSHDGSLLAFYSCEGNEWELSLQKRLEKNSRKLCRLQRISDGCCPPLWTDNGMSVITIVKKGSLFLLAEINIENSTIITRDWSEQGIESPCLSPDSRYLYYFKMMDDREELWRADRSLNTRVRLANSRAGERKPCLDVSSSQIVFTRNGDLWIISSDGKNKEHLLSPQGEEKMPLFSPDGLKIAFISIRGNNRDIFTFSFKQ